MGYGKWIAFQMDAKTKAKTIVAEGPAGPGMSDPTGVKRHWIAGEVAVGWEPDEADQQLKKLAPSTLAKRRRSRLTNQLQAKMPLFAAQLEQRELDERPGFYRGE